MKRALSNLYTDPHNRFKIFKNGRFLLAESCPHRKPHVERELAEWMGNDDGDEQQGGVVNRLSSLVCTALLAPLGRGGSRFEVSREMVDTEPRGSRGGQARYKSCVSAETQLPRGCILGKLLVLQVRFDLIA